jgi:hypothetical protein
MKGSLLSLSVALFILLASAQAQNSKSTTRLQKQHNVDTQFLRSHLRQTTESLAQALQDTSVSRQITAVQDIRELEQVFPEYPFSAVLRPLEQRLEDEKTDPVVRRLVALALDGLHSDAGDAIMRVTAASTSDPGLQILCKALLIESGLDKSATSSIDPSEPATRFEKQHKLATRFLREHLKQTEQSLSLALKDTVLNRQITAVQDIRELEQVFPAYPFSLTLGPLEERLEDKKTDPVVRRLAALALDELHSDAGDAMIKAMADSSPDKDLQILCNALLVKGQLYK